jgi:hypothetical protein
VQRDLVLRWIEQLGRLVARLVGLGGKAELATARDQVTEATINLLGPLSLLVPRLETASAAELLADPDRIFGYAQLLDLDGAISEAIGEKDAAADSRRRAVEFAREAVTRATEPRREWELWIAGRVGSSDH